MGSFVLACFSPLCRSYCFRRFVYLIISINLLFLQVLDNINLFIMTSVSFLYTNRSSSFLLCHCALYNIQTHVCNYQTSHKLHDTYSLTGNIISILLWYPNQEWIWKFFLISLHPCWFLFSTKVEQPRAPLRMGEVALLQTTRCSRQAFQIRLNKVIEWSCLLVLDSMLATEQDGSFGWDF